LSLVPTSVRRVITVDWLKLHQIEISGILAAREEASPDIDLMLDVNWPWTLTQAHANARSNWCVFTSPFVNQLTSAGGRAALIIQAKASTPVPVPVLGL